MQRQNFEAKNASIREQFATLRKTRAEKLRSRLIFRGATGALGSNRSPNPLRASNVPD